jgi:hypothetical protein
MSTPILTYSFELLSDYSLEFKAEAIIKAMTGNPNFPNPTPALQDISFLLSEYKQEKDIFHKNKKRDELVRLLHNLAGYVSYKSNGDKDKLMSSGFDISIERRMLVEIGKPENLQVTGGKNPGELQLSTSRVVGAIFYNFQFTNDPIKPNSLWVSHIDTTNKFTLKHLEKGQKYWCRVGAVGMDDRMTFSDVVEGIVS